MTVYIEKPAVNLREELASLRNQGGYEEQQFWMDGLVTNGTFDVDAYWIKGVGWSISGGKATHVGPTSGAMAQSVGIVAGKVYTCIVTVSGLTTGNVYWRVGGQTSLVTISTNGTFTNNITAEAVDDQIELFGSATFDGSIDNVSVFETDGTDVIHRMPKGWVPLHVYEDGLLQREGAANDYEVVYDGFDYYVKPAVAPSATTQTCVIGVRK